MRVRWTTASAVTASGIATVVTTFAVLAWLRRWMCDDGFIYVRVARQIVAGYGPVYNIFERTEAGTSTLWTYLVALVHGIVPGDPAYATVIFGGLLSVAGLLVALDANRRWLRALGIDGPLIPFAALFVLAIFPFRDYATSGLETGLTTLWLAGVWWLLVELRPEATRRRQLVIAFVYGLGPLVRPELSLVTIVFSIAAWRIIRPSRRRTLLLVATALALPFVYEIFRAGYYGVLVPLPAIAKSAATSEWGRGLRYAGRFVRTYMLWVPLLVVAAAVIVGHRKRAITPVVVAPVVSGLVLLVFIVRVGGDFMHGRMMLPPLLLVIMPVLLLPFERRTLPAAIGIAIWALIIGIAVRSVSPLDGYNRDWDERVNYVTGRESENPASTSAHMRGYLGHGAVVEYRQMTSRPLLIWDVNGAALPLDPSWDAPVAIAAGWLGEAGAVVPLEGIAADLYGLANPIAAHLTRTQPGKIGHEKLLPWAWVIADYTDPEFDEQQPFDRVGTTPKMIRAARHAMTCGELEELLASVREPLTASRFWSNLTGAFSRTLLVVPADPLEAERTFCR